MPRKDSDCDAVRPGIWRRRIGVCLGGLLVIAVGVALRIGGGPARAQAQQTRARNLPPTQSASPAASPPAAASAPPASPHDLVATVNGEQITREQLAAECLRHYGADVLETMVNKFLISTECQKRKITVTDPEIKAEIDRMAERFGVPTDQWLELLEKERSIKPQQYARDIIWPTVALRKLATSQLRVSPQEVREAYETQYGPAVQCRLIACANLDDAKKIHAQALAKPTEFGNLAKQHSIDPHSASAKGLIQPIRKHLGDKKIEEAAFHLQPGAISDVIPVGEQFVILQCDKHLPARNVELKGKVEQLLIDAIRDKKLRLVADDVFEDLQSQSKIDLVYNDPDKRAAQPDVAAIVNGQQLPLRNLSDECVARHGRDVLEAMISRRLLEQACRAGNITVSETDVDAEIAHAAALMGRIAQGRPDVNKWLDDVTKEQNISVEIYRHDSVVPSVMLKKLVGKGVEVTEADLQKGFEANYGPRVRCLAIVMDNQRRAQEVWDKARKNRTAEYFGELAEEYSVDASTRVLRGEIPPIQKHGGEPQLEKEAFSLNEADPLSGIIQIGEQFVILYYQGLTQPEVKDFALVRDEIYNDLYEKKLRLAMAAEFQRLEDNARIVNKLTGEAHAPAENQEVQPPAGARPVRQTGLTEPAAKRPAPPKR